MKKLIELTVGNEQDRLEIAAILIKNGYACSQAKTKAEGQQKASYKLIVYSQGGE